MTDPTGDTPMSPNELHEGHAADLDARAVTATGQPMADLLDDLMRDGDLEGRAHARHVTVAAMRLEIIESTLDGHIDLAISALQDARQTLAAGRRVNPCGILQLTGLTIDQLAARHGDASESIQMALTQAERYLGARGSP